MADGDNLIIGMPNQGESVTSPDLSGTKTNTALIVRNLNGNGFEANATGAGAIGILGVCRRSSALTLRPEGDHRCSVGSFLPAPGLSTRQRRTSSPRGRGQRL